MRLHRLELAAFGPFAGRQSVDFDELSAAGLFLLHGPTGAGKTSVLDGVCYALYGQVPGARPANRLRSDHAAPGTPTEVVLELTVGGRRLEVTRRPEQPRAKKRGTGVTVDKAVTLLRERSEGQWRGLSTSHQEIGEEIRQLLGMSCEQFCQVVLLPQGEFATFLRAGAVERTALLGRLFDTRRFKAVEGRLREMKGLAARHLADGDAELDRLAARMRQAAGPGAGPDVSADSGALAGEAAEGRPGPGGSGADGGPGETGDTGDLLAWAAVLRCDARERHTSARLAALAAEAAHTAASEEAARARDLHALQRRHAEARARAAALEAEGTVRAQARAALARARAAAAVGPALALREEAAAHHAEASRRAAAALAALPAADEPLAPAAGPSAPRLPHQPRTPGGSPIPPGADPHEAAGAGRPAPGPGGRPAARQGAEAFRHPQHDARTTSTVAVPPPADGRAAESDDDPPDREPAVRAAESEAAAEPAAGSEGDAARLAGVRLPAAGCGGPVPTRGDASGDEPGRRARESGGGDPDAAPPEGGARGHLVPAQSLAPQATIPAATAATHVAPAVGDVSSTAPSTPPAHAAHEVSADQLAGRAGELRQELGSLAGAGGDEARLGEIGGRRRALEREEAADEEAAREAQSWLDDWPRVRGGLQDRVDATAEAAARAAGLAAALEAARRRLDAAAERDRLVRESGLAEDGAREARDRAATAREDWQDLREARFAGVAAELAGELADGHPCRVCGSTEHPAPAVTARRPVRRADEESAYARYQDAADAYERARSQATRLAAALEAARAAAGGTPAAELAAEHERLARDQRAAAELAGALPEARAALTRAEEERDRRAARRQQAHGRAAARASRREELDDQHERLAAELGRARGGFASVQERRRHLSERIALLDRAVHAVRARSETAARLAEAGAALDRSAAAAGFATPAEAEAALMPAPRLREAELREEIWAKQEAALDAELTAPEPAAAAALPPADAVAAQTALDLAHRRLRETSSAESSAAERCRELDRLGAAATALARRLGPSRDAYARVRRLADLAAATTAENRYRMELETYVLAARLEQVAAAAGVRLQRMSAGRYTLVHSDARTGGRGKSGLGLMVVDAWTGTERDTATLSGGETFFASLALALGLADVVSDESGGTRLDTLFIDEGFGSLDDQTLDEVLDVLDGLRERDRAVGIVSHVADLRHRIPVQLRVVKDRGGSTVRMRTGNGPHG